MKMHWGLEEVVERALMADWIVENFWDEEGPTVRHVVDGGEVRVAARAAGGKRERIRGRKERRDFMVT